MLRWTLDHNGQYHSTDGRFDLYLERRPENDNRLTWTLIDREGTEGVENGFDTHADAAAQADRLDDAMTVQRNADHGVALDESIRRAKTTNRHDKGLILALAQAGHMWWNIATWLGLSDDYVRLLINAENMRTVR
jgi:hypothetical protein